MKCKLFIILTVALMAAICLTACELTVEKDKEDEFSGEYVEVTEEEDIDALCLKVLDYAEKTDGKSIEYVMAIDAKLETQYKTYDLGAKLTVLKDMGEEGARDTYTFFTFGGYSQGNYLKDEYFIYYVKAENATYYRELATLEEKQEKTTSESKYKRSDYQFDALTFAAEKGYNFNFFGGEEIYDLKLIAAAMKSGEVGIYRMGDEKLKLTRAFDEAQAEEYGYKGCAYYLMLAEDNFKIKVVMTYNDADGNEQETDKTMEIYSVDYKVTLPDDLEEYEEKE